MNRNLIILFCLFCFHAYSQDLDFQFKNFSKNDGLEQNSVLAIEQGEFGQMWIGTRDGLNKYDGTSFTTYQNNPNDSLSISKNEIYSLYNDSEGSLWVGTTMGLNKFNPKKNNFERFKNHDGLANNVITCISEFKNELWVGTNKGLFVFDSIRKKLVTLFYLENNSQTISDNYITKILVTKDKNVWVGTKKGPCKLIKREGDKFHFKRYALINNVKESQINFHVNDLLETSDGDVLIASKKSGLLKYVIKEDKVIMLRLKDVDLDCRAILYDPNGNLWIGTYNGMFILDPKGQLTRLDNNLSLEINKVKSIFKDVKGSMWVGTYYNGLYLWDKNIFNFTNIKNKQSNNVIGAIKYSTNNDRLYLGIEGGGLSVLNKKEKKISKLSKGYTKNINIIKSLLLREKENELIIGTFAKGIISLNQTTLNQTNLFSKELNNFIEDTGVYDIKQNGDYIWIATLGKGLICFNTLDRSFLVVQSAINKFEPLSSNLVRSIFIDDDRKELWVATIRGLNVIYLDDFYNGTLKYDQYFFNKKTHSGFSILSLFKDKEGTMWVGTKSQGLYRFNGGAFDKIWTSNSINEVNSIYSILQDDRGDLWLSSDSGFAKLDITTLKVKIYNKDNRLNGDGYPTALKIDDKLYFGGPDGITFFKPENIKINAFAPQVLITDFKINRESLPIKNSGGVLQEHIAFTEQVSLAHDKANFSISYAIPNFINPENNSYTYRLKGLNNDWITTSDTEVFFTIQESGEYTFEVKGANNDNVWNATSTMFDIKVKPAPWKSWWAFVIYVILIFLALILIIWFSKSKSNLKYELEFKQFEKERIEELTTNKLKFFTNISHEFRTPLTLISGPLQQVLSNYKGSKSMHNKLLIIEKNTKHLMQLINRLMDFRKLENDKLKLEASKGDIVLFLKNIFSSFSDYAANHHYTYTFIPEHEEMFVYYDTRKLEQVFFNLISNAFKFTREGGVINITLNYDKNNENIIIEVQDNGIGVSDENIEKVFDRFYEIPIENTKDGFAHSIGIGLYIVQNIIKLHKGLIKADNSKIGSTVFRVSLPLGKEHLIDEEIVKDSSEIIENMEYYHKQLEQNENIKIDIESYRQNENFKTVLVVEDNNDLRLFIKQFLEDTYNVIEAENGEIGLQKALKHIPDIIISDVVMPKMTGIELCTSIKSNLKTSHIPFVLLTSRTSQVYKFEGLEKGANEYINKPFNLNEFLLRVKNLLESTNRLKDKFSSENNFNPSEITLSSLDENLLKKAYEIVENNIANDKFDIPSFCSEIGLSRTVLFSKIKAWTKLTPNNFIQEIRLKRAAFFLEQNKLNISRVAYETGFNDPNYFSKCFQKKYGLSPSQFKNKFSQDDTD